MREKKLQIKIINDGINKECIFITKDLKGFKDQILQIAETRDKNVFLMSKYGDLLENAEDKLINIFKKYDLNLIIAKKSRKSGDVSNNPLISALSSKYGLLILDESSDRKKNKSQINPNATFEFGFMRHFTDKNNLCVIKDEKIDINKNFSDIKDYDYIEGYKHKNITHLLCIVNEWIGRAIIQKENELQAPSFSNLDHWERLEYVGAGVTTNQGFNKPGKSNKCNINNRIPSKEAISCFNEEYDMWNGYRQSVRFINPKPANFIFGCWSKVIDFPTKRTKGHYGVEIDIPAEGNFNPQYHYIPFSTTTKDWQLAVKKIIVDRSVSSLSFYVLFRGYKGKVLFDNAFLMRLD